MYTLPKHPRVRICVVYCRREIMYQQLCCAVQPPSAVYRFCASCISSQSSKPRHVALRLKLSSRWLMTLALSSHPGAYLIIALAIITTEDTLVSADVPAVAMTTTLITDHNRWCLSSNGSMLVDTWWHGTCGSRGSHISKMLEGDV